MRRGWFDLCKYATYCEDYRNPARSGAIRGRGEDRWPCRNSARRDSRSTKATCCGHGLERLGWVCRCFGVGGIGCEVRGGGEQRAHARGDLTGGGTRVPDTAPKIAGTGQTDPVTVWVARRTS